MHNMAPVFKGRFPLLYKITQEGENKKSMEDEKEQWFSACRGDITLSGLFLTSTVATAPPRDLPKTTILEVSISTL